ncbi:long-chain fatty acid--CoA ligase [Cupriavidus pinatubonensis]|uniref:Long-chain-fatty-acid--CoA ligase n=1 Tax=Cupriavidus pinatubonensis TaxID=248026 RepID=A0ABN7Z389_9BURK|nr:long-chain fatty acid--CoA ligase [Cupriavidus pinatubonensis]CAG9180377.1 Long-chain-fatty-acid--CoA ligase [Cupriavidus pinatubonensis]
MDRFWLKHYPAGVPAEIDASQFRSLAQLLEHSFRTYADRRAFVCMDKAITYGELDRMSAHFAAWLQSRGLRPGARVAIMMPNVLQYPVVLAAVLRAGFVVVNVNPLYTPRELEHQLKDSGAEAIVILENFATTLQQVLARTPVKHVVVASMGDLLGGLKGAIVNFVVRNVKKMVPEWELPNCVRFNAVLGEGRKLTLQPATTGPDDVAFLQYTGGTTGVSKGAVLLHRNVVANVLQSEAWMQPALNKGEPIEQVVTITALPLYHIFALTVCCLLGMRNGGMSVLIPNPRDIPGFIKELQKYKFHMFPAVNTLYNALLNNPEIGKVDFSGLRVANGGGMAVQEAVAKQWLAKTGCPIIEGYGLSETSPSATCNPTDSNAFSGTIGLPLPSTEIAIRDDDRRDVPLGQPGEICIRGPQVMAGYWNRPDETAKVMTPDGFFKTGDIGVMDERGYTKIVDRKKDMILVSGFNVYPNEIEGVAAECPGVLEVAAVGVPDTHSGEVVKLYVVKKDPALTEADVIEFCKERLTGYKRPKYVEFRTELPKTNVGKILRRELRDTRQAA